MTEKIYHPLKLTEELLGANLPVVSVSSDGRVDYSRELTKTERNLANSILSAHDPTPQADELRLKAYTEAGITIEKMVFALWRELKCGDSTDADKIFSEMKDIDAGIH